MTEHEYYCVQTQPYVKLMLHAAKWPATAIFGLLLGHEQGQGFVILDAVPLFHHEVPLTPLLEVACAMVDASCQKARPLVKIVGVYYAESGSSLSLSNHGLGRFAQKVADLVEQNCSRACVLVVDNQQLEDVTASGVHLLLKDVKRGWTRVDHRLKVSDEATQVLTKGVQQQKVLMNLVDFEEHLEDIRKDWRNPHLVGLLQLNV